jgi:hypothetical protein
MFASDIDCRFSADRRDFQNISSFGRRWHDLCRELTTMTHALFTVVFVKANDWFNTLRRVYQCCHTISLGALLSKNQDGRIQLR